jgi:5-methylcytosine-specific restriction endonuclease McrA
MPISPENRKRYPSHWPQLSHELRFGRAGGRCEWCGAVHGQPHPRTGSKVVLTVAHVHDKRPEACDPANLAALCQDCHNRHDAADRLANRRRRMAAAVPPA